ncbi:MAG TPA: dihydrofolate reductase family protein [Ktedonosporobacter sp.]|nr:dihydrofolate reductase family protein [Ktedonosporobacter sp.]
MEPIITLYERQTAPVETLPPDLAQLYGGGLSIPASAENGLPYVIANFVETLDGVVSYNAPGQNGGGVISGENEQDQMVMGLLRAQADVVIFGTSSLRHDANHVHTPSFIYPALAAEYDALRTQLGKRERLPMSVIMTASGQVDLRDRTFHVPGLRTLIVTSARGYDHLSRQNVPPETEVHVLEPAENDNGYRGISPRAVLELLAREYDIRLALYEGGPTLLASFLAEQLLDELFLTLAPQIAGRTPDLSRLGLVEGRAFLPSNAIWATLLSTKLAGSHLLLRYQLK